MVELPGEVQDRIIIWRNKDRLSLEAIAAKLEEEFGEKYKVSIATLSKWIKAIEERMDGITLDVTDIETQRKIRKQPEKILDGLNLIEREALERIKEIKKDKNEKRLNDNSRNLNKLLQTLIYVQDRRIELLKFFRVPVKRRFESKEYDTERSKRKLLEELWESE